MKRWDIFCRVIDNFGDIGVCWRLANQLYHEHNLSIRLWVDDLGSLAKLLSAPEVTDDCWINGIHIRHWQDQLEESITPADVVIEAFACDIPPAYLQQMIALKCAGKAPRWINLEYLSAEPWVEDCHLMASIHPASGLKKTFFFPGFTPRTGGLLREKSITNQNSTKAEPLDSPYRISLFAYENNAVTSLISGLLMRNELYELMVPEGRVLTSVNKALGKTISPHEKHTIDNVTISVLPFSTQAQYDVLLASCDLNFVRGEDSFVRAQWAGKPFVWHIYEQEENAHFVKLDAFLERFTSHLPGDLSHALIALWHEWNLEQNIEQPLNTCLDSLSLWHQGVALWREYLCQQEDLASQLVAHVVESE